MDSSLEPRKPLILSQKKKSLFQNSQNNQLKSQPDNFNESSSYLGPSNLELSQMINGSQSSRILNKINSQHNLCEQLEDVKGQKMIQSYQYQKSGIESHRYDHISFQEDVAVSQLENLQQKVKILTENNLKLQESLISQEQKIQDLEKVKSDLEQSVSVLESDNVKLVEEIKAKSVALERSEKIFKEENERHYRDKYIKLEETQSLINDKDKAINNLNSQIDMLQRELQMVTSKSICAYDSSSKIISSGNFQSVDFLKLQIATEKKLLENDKLLVENERIQLKNEKDKIESDKEHIEQMIQSLQGDRQQFEQEKQQFYLEQNKFQKKLIELNQNSLNESVLKQQIENLKEIIENQQKTIEDQIQRVQSEEDKDKYQKLFEEQQNKIVQADEKIQQFESQLQEFQMRKQQDNEQINKLLIENQNYEIKLIESEQTRNQLTNQINQYQKQNELVSSDQMKIDQEVSQKDKDLLNKNTALEEEIIELKKQKQQLEQTNNEILEKEVQKNEKLEEEIRVLKESLLQKANKIQQISKNSFEYQLKIEELQIQLSEITHLNNNQNEISDLTDNSILQSKKTNYIQLQESINLFDISTQNLIYQPNKSGYLPVNQQCKQCKSSQLVKQQSENMEQKLVQLQSDYQTLLAENENLISKQKEFSEIMQSLKNQIRLLNISKDDLQKYCDSLEQHLSQSQLEHENNLKQLEEQKSIQISALQQELEVYHKNSNIVSSSLKSAGSIFKNYVSQKENISYQSISKKQKQQQREPQSPHKKQNDRNEQLTYQNDGQTKYKNYQQYSAASPINKAQLHGDIKDRDNQIYKQYSFQNQRETNYYKHEKDLTENKRLQVICAKTKVSPLRTSLNITNIRDTSANRRQY